MYKGPDLPKKRVMVEFDNKRKPTTVTIIGERHTLRYKLTEWGVLAALEIIEAYLESGWVLNSKDDRVAYRRMVRGTQEYMLDETDSDEHDEDRGE